ncbi:inner membrane protein [Klebsiella pneumoniae]|nr:inner membrane protein [Klebsiella pneumoniae]
MNTDNASLYVKWLKQEVAPALGCTEPVAISFAAAYAAQYLDQPCTKISGFISANLYKNAGNDSNLLIVFYVQIMPDDFVMQLHRF